MILRFTPVLRVVLLGLAAVASSRASLAEDGADLIQRHGAFHTVQPASRVEGSLGGRAGRIVDLGPDSGVERCRRILHDRESAR